MPYSSEIEGGESAYSQTPNSGDPPDESEQYQPTPEEAKLAAKINNLYSTKRYAKRAYEKTWFMTHAFIVGQQWIAYNDYSRQFITNVKVPSYRVRLVDNKMLGAWEKRNTKILRSKPIVKFIPATHEDDDVARARHKEKVMEAEARRTRLEEIDHELVRWATKTGTAFYKIWWDRNSGQKIPITSMTVVQNVEDPMTPMTIVESPVLDEKGEQVFEYMGNVAVEVCSPFEIDVDPQATASKQPQWIMQSNLMPREWIRENFPEKGKFVPKSSMDENTYYSRRMRDVVGILGYSSESASARDMDADVALYQEYYEHPSKNYPNGRMIVMAGGVILFDGEYLDSVHWHPFVAMRDVTVDGRFWGMSIMEQAIPLQKAKNKLLSQAIEDHNLCTRPKVRCPNGANIKKATFDSEPGEIVFFNPQQGMGPEYMSRPMEHLASYEHLHKYLQLGLDDVTGQHEVARGRIPPGVESGVAIEMLQEAEEDRLEGTIHSFVSAKKELAVRWMKLIKRYWTENRLINVVGEGESPETFWFAGEDVEGEDPHADYYNVDMQIGSALSLSKSARQARLISLVNAGLLDRQRDQRTILNYLDLGLSENIYNEDRLDENMAKRNNRLMANGIMPPVYPWQNHEIHLREINRFRKHPLFERLPPQSQVIFDKVAMMHSRYIMQSMQAMQAGLLTGPEGPPKPNSGIPRPGRIGEVKNNSEIGERMNDRQSDIQSRIYENRTGIPAGGD